jgi:Ca-activated chloride channel family protein
MSKLISRKLPHDLRFAAAVAGSAQLLRQDPYLKNFSYTRAIEIAQGARGEDAYGYRSEFVQLMRLAQSSASLQPLDPSRPGSPQ